MWIRATVANSSNLHPIVEDAGDQPHGDDDRELLPGEEE